MAENISFRATNSGLMWDKGRIARLSRHGVDLRENES